MYATSDSLSGRQKGRTTDEKFPSKGFQFPQRSMGPIYLSQSSRSFKHPSSAFSSWMCLRNGYSWQKPSMLGFSLRTSWESLSAWGMCLYQSMLACFVGLVNPRTFWRVVYIKRLGERNYNKWKDHKSGSCWGMISSRWVNSRPVTSMTEIAVHLIISLGINGWNHVSRSEHSFIARTSKASSGGSKSI